MRLGRVRVSTIIQYALQNEAIYKKEPRLLHSTLNQELAHLTSVFQRNGYPRPLTCRALRISPTPTNRDRLEPKATVSIPFVKGVRERIKRICPKRGIRVYF